MPLVFSVAAKAMIARGFQNFSRNQVAWFEMIRTKRIYEKPSKQDGYRVLADRLWPRGVSKDQAKIDLWLREIAPSDSLRKWFHHETGNWNDFKKKYELELKKKQSLLLEIKRLEKEKGTITLLYSAKDVEHNQAAVLSKILLEI